MDEEQREACCLTFDLILVCAPLREDGTFEAREARAVQQSDLPPSAVARYRGIRVSLLQAMGMPAERGGPDPAASPARIRRLGVERDGPTQLD